MNCIKNGKFTGDSCFGCKVYAVDCEIRDRIYKNRWISVSERLPKNEERVLICADRKCFNGKVIQIRTTAMYEDGTMHTEESGCTWEDNDFEYCDEKDDYIIPEGWWEQNMYGEEFSLVDDFVTHWMPLPDYPLVR
uniref:DUF551 domain-containing protein n=1 Tax=Caudovirales sp. ctCiv1 TaxID=2826769 RepID=A0A8S5M8A6_9CAUD|nr:DUF551 domain-containing protein [uncultured Lachnoclostridium sp.]DAD78525.1 MAG TPA: Protein of unknown function (DUF551) [Caudovirales sp. ctCiv1]